MDHLAELKPVFTPLEFNAAQEWAYEMDGDGSWVDDPSYELPPGFHVEAALETIVIGGPISPAWAEAKGFCEIESCHQGPDLTAAQAYFHGMCKWHHDLAWYQAGMPESDIAHLWWNGRTNIH